MKRFYLGFAALALVCFAEAALSQDESGTSDKTIVEVAVASKDFKTLVTALKAADLVKTLSGEGPFTVFAPTDKAFAKLPKETLADLLKPENKKKLIAILTYHVIAKKVMATDVIKLKEVKTVQGSSAKITVRYGKVKIDNANVVKTDIVCKNGVIHVIDAVILPKEEPATEEPATEEPDTEEPDTEESEQE